MELLKGKLQNKLTNKSYIMEDYSLVCNSITDLYEVHYAFAPWWMMAASLGVSLLWGLKKWLWDTKPTSQTKSVVILGRKASGKTTLWNRLRGYNFNKNYVITALDKIEQFTINRDDKQVIIQATKDIGGDKKWVREYEELIKERTFILFLVDATDSCEDAQADIRARVQKILNIVNNNKLDKVGFRIYITHSDEYLSRNPQTTYAMIIEQIKKWLDLDSIKAPKKVKYEYYAVDLSCDKDIDTIKKEIIDSVYE